MRQLRRDTDTAILAARESEWARPFEQPASMDTLPLWSQTTGGQPLYPPRVIYLKAGDVGGYPGPRGRLLHGG